MFSLYSNDDGIECLCWEVNVGVSWGIGKFGRLVNFIG